MTPLRILKTIVLDDAEPAKANDWTSLSLDELERVGFPSGGAGLKRIKKVAINEQAPEGSLTGRLPLFEGSHGTYLQLDLTVMPRK